MVTQIKLKILAFGSQMMLRRLAVRIDPAETCITGCSEALEAVNLLAKEQFDIVIIDSSFQDAENICRSITGITGAPVALMLREATADWKQIRNLGVDGFLPEEAGNAELMARIKACSRRKTDV